ncbi:MAG: hypothetical protein A3G59_00650 [Candidatus Taylorbacteria bacterium RIFCSPLOWO2_12_FULL_47_20]|uniref:Uncharacterized protein n=2 Tax=Candidatus Tayloriibacteriota TaxID=1817919 RepID=A0A1G2P985_9BACT|nr:MAG: hypothetical protein A3H68_01245 [Candidatus Taylorbacteria bacterium RIFCSPLOWO2_02_FULL_46_40]OHA44151.1 MAG: hypothetical protein A3G59_00650 [Candidatus Taylorbacteria bacterium RIFCSPLOWO2_12_FULL_47_20]
MSTFLSVFLSVFLALLGVCSVAVSVLMLRLVCSRRTVPPLSKQCSNATIRLFAMTAVGMFGLGIFFLLKSGLITGLASVIFPDF